LKAGDSKEGEMRKKDEGKVPECEGFEEISEKKVRRSSFLSVETRGEGGFPCPRQWGVKKRGI
jgi:hypothetical protein